MKAHKSEHSLRAEWPFAKPLASGWDGFTPDAMERSADGMRALQEENVKFLTKRFESNVEAAKRLSTCRSLPEVFAAQQKWFADMAQAYSEEWVRCTGLMTATLQEDAKSPNNGAERSDKQH
jgi:hypothetical protein